MKASKTVLVRVLFAVFATALYYPVCAQLKADFSATAQQGCTPLVVSFKDSSLGNPTAWFWDLGNGVTSTEKNPVTYYFDPGTYSVKLIVRKNDSPSDTVVKVGYITVYQNPTANFSLSDSVGCTPLAINYTNTSKAGSGNIIKSVWDFGDGNNANIFAPTHTYGSAGTYSVALTVINSFGCTNTVAVKKTIRVLTSITAGFTYNNSLVCKSPGTVFLQQASITTGSNLLCEWNLGDKSATVLGTSVSHNYLKEGDYRVFLKVTPEGGCTDTISKTIHVAFVKSSIAINDTVCASSGKQFVNTSTPAPASAYWLFGDSTNSNSLSPFKTYAKPGDYTVTLVNNFFNGCSDTVSKIVHVKTPPAASFMVIDSATCATPFTAGFTNKSQGSGLSYSWDFGDGSTTTIANPKHQYTKQGEYTVTLKTFSVNGCASTFTKPAAVVIKPIQITGVTGFSLAKCIPATVHAGLSTSVPASVAKYSWDFGDGYISADSSPVHAYTVAGIYTAKVTIQTIGGCTASYSVVDSIGQKLHPSFTVSPAEACASSEVTFNNTTKTGSTFLWWYPGDGDTIYNQPNPAHNYQDTGWFSPKLVVMEYGCYDTLIKTDSVHITGPIARFTTKNSCVNKKSIAFTNSSIEDFTRTWSFGDGTTDTSANPVHLYRSAGTYKTSLYVSNGVCNFKQEQTVRVVNEQGKINLVDSILCRDATLNLAVTGVNNANIDTTWWKMGNGTVLIEPQNNATTYNYSVNGKYAITAVVKDVLGCRDTLKKPYQLSVFGPQAKFAAQQTGTCKNGFINFTDSSVWDGAHSIIAWKFNFGDSDAITYPAKTAFAHNYRKTGYFTTVLTVTDNIGCSDSTFAKPILITQPHANFKLSDTLVCPGKQITFTNTSTGNSVRYKWDLGDGSQASEANPSHVYSSQGAYNPRLFITDINGCKDSAVGSTVHMFKPSATFALIDSFTTCPPLNVSFTNQSANYTNIQWNFGDANTSTNTSPQHVYTSPGVYTAKVVLGGNGGCADSAVKTITVKGPTGNLAYDNTARCYPFTQKISASSKTAVQFLWDYSDGTTNTTSDDTTSHVYQPGFYVPKMILIDAEGCKVPIKGIDTIKVYGIKAAAVIDHHIVCDSGIINFKDTSITNDAIQSSQWAFGDNTYGYGSALAHTYNTAGTYYVRLIDITVNGCSDTQNIPTPVKITVSPVISIKGATSFCAPATVPFDAVIVKANNEALSWKWDFGNGDTAVTQSPTNQPYSNAGSYQVTVTAIGTSGCQGTASTTVVLHAAPTVKTLHDTIICRNSAIRLTATGAASYIWNSAASLSCTKCGSPLAIADSTTLYTVTGTDEFGCTAKDSVVVSVTQPVKISVSGSDTLCNGNSKKLSASGAQRYKWLPAIYLSDASTSQPTFFASKDTAITYKVIGYTNNNCFADSATIKVKVYPVPEMQVTEKTVTAAAGSAVQLGTVNSPDVTKWKWTPAMWLDNPNAANPVAQPRESVTYTVVAANDGACVTRAQLPLR